ncbi:MAG: zf-HC2 domain-containing protein [Phycisphaerae bacterium]|jgi:anti-sigma factor RsiW|nr:zf-HC2 domain-containing protein [Phycisphaerae bacterium]MCZ2399402.1 zf-HC2 domain-containing protein [Phycisphaerae bacterium]NUQ49297.1 zf-HC2 domain-containing protein [Phycisphaerae bacterium]
MNCGDVERLLDAHLDGQLSGSLRLEFEAHRVRCRRCQQTLAMLEACTHVIATDHRQPALSDDFTDRLMSRIADGSPRLRVRRLAIGAAVALQAAAAVLFVSLMWPWQAPPGRPELPAEPTFAHGTGLRDQRALVEAQEVLRSEILGVMSAKMEAGRPIRSHWADLVQSLNLDISEPLAQQLQNLATGDFLGALMPGFHAPPPVVSDKSFSL